MLAREAADSTSAGASGSLQVATTSAMFKKIYHQFVIKRSIESLSLSHCSLIDNLLDKEPTSPSRPSSPSPADNEDDSTSPVKTLVPEPLFYRRPDAMDNNQHDDDEEEEEDPLNSSRRSTLGLFAPTPNTSAIFDFTLSEEDELLKGLPRRQNKKKTTKTMAQKTGGRKVLGNRTAPEAAIIRGLAEGQVIVFFTELENL